MSDTLIFENMDGNLTKQWRIRGLGMLVVGFYCVLSCVVQLQSGKKPFLKNMRCTPTWPSYVGRSGPCALS